MEQPVIRRTIDHGMGHCPSAMQLSGGLANAFTATAHPACGSGRAGVASSGRGRQPGAPTRRRGRASTRRDRLRLQWSGGDPISTATNKPGKAIKVPGGAVVITPNGKTIYVSGFNGDPVVTPISTATNKPGKPIMVARNPSAVTVTPDSKTLCIVDQDSNDVIAVSTTTSKPVGFVPTGGTPVGIAITPNGASGYVANFDDLTLTPFTVATNTAGTPPAPHMGLSDFRRSGAS
jgi:hypothetical protein